jgi:hypothetical protein
LREIASQHHYFADIFTASNFCTLTISDIRKTELIIHFHGFGVKFSGILAAEAFINYRSADPFHHELKRDGPYALNDVFLIPFNEPREQIEERFRQWLNTSTETGVRQWSARI